MTTKTKIKKEVYWRCKKCGALGVDGCEFYARLIGNEKDREEVKKRGKL